ncbi:MIF4G domain-containing protein / MA3 domain-containing protein [Wolffia australiana]
MAGSSRRREEDDGSELEREASGRPSERKPWKQSDRENDLDRSNLRDREEGELDREPELEGRRSERRSSGRDDEGSRRSGRDRNRERDGRRRDRERRHGRDEEEEGGSSPEKSHRSRRDKEIGGNRAIDARKRDRGNQNDREEEEIGGRSPERSHRSMHDNEISGNREIEARKRDFGSQNGSEEEEKGRKSPEKSHRSRHDKEIDRNREIEARKRDRGNQNGSKEEEIGGRKSPEKSHRSRRDNEIDRNREIDAKKRDFGSQNGSKEEEIGGRTSPEKSHRSKPNKEIDRNREIEARKRREEKEEILPPPPPLPDAIANAGRSGGVYIPPFKMAQMMRDVQDKSSDAYQRLSWDALRKSINGLVNKVNATNIKNIIPELFSENLIRGRGLFCRSCFKSQMASPGFTDVFAALVAVVNTKFPEVGKLLLNRIVLQLKRAYKRNDKPQLLAATKFIAHLVNQQVAHEIIALELLTVLLENPTDDSVEVAVGFVKECGSLLQDISPQGLHGIFERFRGILHEGEIDKRVQFLIEGLFAIRKAKFQGFPAVRPELDLVEVEDQFTHEVSLEDEIDPETGLDIFKSNPRFLEDEKAYEDLKKSILGDDESSGEDDGSDAGGSDEEDQSEEEEDEEDEEMMKIKDETETNLVNLRRTIYLTIMSSVDFEEAGHKLLKIKLEPGQEMELCIMLLECCSQERTYLRYYGLLGQRFCMINKVHQENFETCFVQQYSMIHRLETNKLRNVAKFFAHLLGTDALPWHVLAYIRLTEEDTTSSSRIFIKILFQELSEHLGIRLLNERLSDLSMQESFESIFPRDNPKNTRFAINFFTSIGLGGITENLREYLKNMPRLIMQQQQQSQPASDSDSSSDSDSDSDSESDTASDTSSEPKARAKRRRRSR